MTRCSRRTEEVKYKNTPAVFLAAVTVPIIVLSALTAVPDHPPTPPAGRLSPLPSSIGL